jgi:predicted transcriptional regulator
MGNSKPVATYPTEQQHERWKKKADEMGMSMSEWVASMVEAGQKKFTVPRASDSSLEELREQRTELQEELRQSQNRIEILESRLSQSERQEIVDYIHQNPGADFNDIIQHLAQTVPKRVTDLLEEMVSIEVTLRDGRYYPVTNSKK